MQQDSTSPKPFVFVLMPFDKALKDTYELGIRPAADECGTYAERLDDQTFSEDMVQRIHNQINKADFIVADVTGSNPNVFYEVGYAHALNKQVIHICQAGQKLAFDISHRPHIFYESIAGLKEDLSRKLRFFVSTMGSRRADTSTLDVLIRNNHASRVAERLIPEWEKGESPRIALNNGSPVLTLTLRNVGKAPFPEVPFISLLVPQAVPGVEVHAAQGTYVGSGVIQSIRDVPYYEIPLPPFVPVPLLPNASRALSLTLSCNPGSIKDVALPLFLRLVTPEKTLDYPLLFEVK